MRIYIDSSSPIIKIYEKEVDAFADWGFYDYFPDLLTDIASFYGGDKADLSRSEEYQMVAIPRGIYFQILEDDLVFNYDGIVYIEMMLKASKNADQIITNNDIKGGEYEKNNTFGSLNFFPFITRFLGGDEDFGIVEVKFQREVYGNVYLSEQENRGYDEIRDYFNMDINDWKELFSLAQKLKQLYQLEISSLSVKEVPAEEVINVNKLKRLATTELNQAMSLADSLDLLPYLVIEFRTLIYEKISDMGINITEIDYDYKD